MFSKDLFDLAQAFETLLLISYLTSTFISLSFECKKHCFVNEKSRKLNLIFVVIDTRCSRFTLIILVFYWSYLDKHSSFICKFIFKVKRLKMNIIRSSSKSFSKTRKFTFSCFMKSNSFSRVFHLFNFLAVRLIAFFFLDAFFFLILRHHLNVLFLLLH
jgi:hypothetical protein